jgi:hypothetical protein
MGHIVRYSLVKHTRRLKKCRITGKILLRRMRRRIEGRRLCCTDTAEQRQGLVLNQPVSASMRSQMLGAAIELKVSRVLLKLRAFGAESADIRSRSMQRALIVWE